MGKTRSRANGDEDVFPDLLVGDVREFFRGLR